MLRQPYPPQGPELYDDDHDGQSHTPLLSRIRDATRGCTVAETKGKRMFAPSINVDLEKLQKASEEPLKGKRVASRGRTAPRKPKPQPDKDK